MAEHRYMTRISQAGNPINLSDAKGWIKLLKNPKKIFCLIAGILGTSKPEHVLAAGRLFDAAIKWNLLSQLGEELEGYIKRGTIKENFIETKREQTSFLELLKFIEEEVTDDDRFKAIKSIFFISISTQVSETDKILAYELLKICKQLNSGEIVVLKTVYDLVNGKGVNGLAIDLNAEILAAEKWLDVVANQLGHRIPLLVEIYEQKLIDLKLLSERKYNDRSGVNPKNFRLTDLGIKFCEFIIKYDAHN